MKIHVTVKPGAKQNKIEALAENHFRVWVKAPPEDGEANAAVCELMAEHFGVPKSKCQILSGHKSKNKILAIQLEC